jgi:hypothetical protein
MQEQVKEINKRWRELDTSWGQDREGGSYNCYGQNWHSKKKEEIQMN